MVKRRWRGQAVTVQVSSVTLTPAAEVDAAAHSLWSVVVTGPATVVGDPVEHERLARDGPRSWVAPRQDFVRIGPELVTGREIVGGRTLHGVDLTPRRVDLTP